MPPPRFLDQIRDEVGRVDVVFANAGGVIPAPLGSLTEEHIDYHLDTHVKGVIWTVQKALPLMGPGGSIILSASIVASKGWADWSVSVPQRRRSAASLGHGRRICGAGASGSTRSALV
jgi:NAD(P)-dependent dehydrogenase (short-subunit alcohol dehydrogenase family)